MLVSWLAQRRCCSDTVGLESRFWAPKRWDLVSEILQEVKLGLVVLFVVVFAILVLMVLGPVLVVSLI